MKLLKTLPTRRNAILKEYNAGRVYSKLENYGGRYTCANCGKEAFPMSIASIMKENLPPYVSRKDQRLWVKPPNCFLCYN